MLTKIEISADNTLVKSVASSKNITWIDVLQPTAEERQHLLEEYNVVLPLHHEMHQLEFSNRFYQENDALYLSIHVITKAAPLPESHVVTLILSKKMLITLRYSEPNPIEIFISELERRKFYVKDSFEIFMLILNKVVGTVADIFELIDIKAESLSLSLIGTSKGTGQHHRQIKHHNNMLLEINYLEALLGKCYQSLSSLRLLIAFFDETQHELYTSEDCKRLETLVQDIESLSKHAEHLTQKFNFQLQSTLGLINVEQTQIIKIFTVLAMIFMPPTLIASIYGMNFHNLPELGFEFGYPVALGAMVVTAFVPYLMFKRKGWI